MPAKIIRSVTIDGKRYYIRANTEQEYADKLISLVGAGRTGHNFRQYSNEWFNLYSKPNIDISTAETYRRQLRLYLWPALGDLNVEDISVNELQRLFNGMSHAKTTKMKVREVLNMIFESAIYDEIIQKNPLKSKKLRITGADSQVTLPYTVEQMRYLIAHLPDICQAGDRMYLVLQALHPLRLEEVLGLKWGDVDISGRRIHVRRAATHPTRNQAEVKEPKTAASYRTLVLSEIAVKYLTPGKPDEFIFGGKWPLSYTQVRKMRGRIKKDINFEDEITPLRFRTTVLTDIYDKTKDVKATQEAAGHSTPTMTMKYYVKGRTSPEEATRVIEELYSEQVW